MALAACTKQEAESADQRVVAFDSTDIRVLTSRDTTTIRAELAISQEQKTMGLMERHHLAENAGMLFVYDSTQGPEAGFWMFRTRIPLDIAFIDSTGVIRAILGMVPCETTIPEGCPNYLPNVPYRLALETNAGFFQRHGIAVGDKVLTPAAASAASPEQKR